MGFINQYALPDGESMGGENGYAEIIQDDFKRKEGVREEMVKFYHMYVICVRDKDVLHAKLCEGESVFGLVTASDAALAALTLVDNYDGWLDTYEKMEDGTIESPPLNNERRWKMCKGKTKFQDRLRKEPKKFYKDALAFFKVLHGKIGDYDDDLKRKLDDCSIQWWKDNGVQARKRKSRDAPGRVESKQDKRKASAVDDEVFAHYKAMMGNLGKDSGSVDKENVDNDSVPPLPDLPTYPKQGAV